MDIVKELSRRAKRLDVLRKDPKLLRKVKRYYADHPADFISDWGCTYDPRLPSPVLPFVLFPKQREWVDWALDRLESKTPGLTQKSREVGLSWLSVALSVSLCVLHESRVIGFGSAKSELVDKLGDPKSLFWKARQFITMLPVEFRGGYVTGKTEKIRLIEFPDTGSRLVGESGNNIGRGGRTTITFIDEAAHIEHPELIEQSLVSTTECRIDVSTAYGSDNPFARKIREKKLPIFTFSWRDDPRKNEEWYKKKCEEIGDPYIIAQELDMDYTGSVERVVIPDAWIRSAIDAHKALGIRPTGKRVGGFDVALKGDSNALVCFHGVLVESAERWQEQDADIYETTEKVYNLAIAQELEMVVYDADGIGAGVGGDVAQIRKKRFSRVEFQPFHAGGAVSSPKSKDVSDVNNEDFFTNRKAQAWWALRKRFLLTHQAVCGKKAFKPDDIISLSSEIPELDELCLQLGQPTFSFTPAGKVLIDKKSGGASPDFADALMMASAREGNFFAEYF